MSLKDLIAQRNASQRVVRIFAAKTDEAEAGALGRDQAAGAAVARLRLGHLWRGRFHA